MEYYIGLDVSLAESSDADVRDAFGMHLTDLLMLIVGADRDTLELIKGRGLKAARTDAVLRLIAREYASPNLSAGTRVRIVQADGASLTVDGGLNQFG